MPQVQVLCNNLQNYYTVIPLLYVYTSQMNILSQSYKYHSITPTTGLLTRLLENNHFLPPSSNIVYVYIHLRNLHTTLAVYNSSQLPLDFQPRFTTMVTLLLSLRMAQVALLHSFHIVPPLFSFPILHHRPSRHPYPHLHSFKYLIFKDAVFTTRSSYRCQMSQTSHRLHFGTFSA